MSRADDSVDDLLDAPADDLLGEDVDDAENTRVTHLVPEPLRDAAQESAEHGELSERVRTVYRIVATGGVADARTQLQLELEQLRSKKDRLRAEKDDIEAQLRDLERREKRLEERIDQQQSRQDRYAGHLESLSEQIRDGMAVFPGHAAVKQAADVGGKTPEAVIADLKDQNPGLPDTAFTKQGTLDRHERWTGVGGESA